MAYEHQLNEYNTLKGIEYYISYDILDTDGTIASIVNPLVTQDVIECQITWDIRENLTEGHLLLMDKHGLISEMFVHNTMKLTIKAEDVNGIKFHASFAIASIDNEYSTSQKSGIRINFIDVYYNYFNSLYASKGYNNVTMDKVIDDMLNLAPMNITKSKRFSTTKKVYSEFVVPAHRSFANFISKREVIDGFSYINSRDHIYIINPEDLNDPKKIPDMVNGVGAKIIFRDTQDDHKALPFQIKTLKRKYMDVFLSNMVIPTTSEYVFDYNTKTIKGQQNVKTPDYYRSNNLFKDNTYMNSALSTYGSKQSEVSGVFTNDRFYSFKLLENSMLEITTDGSFVIDIMHVVQVYINTFKYDTKMRSTINGLYYVLRVVDKISNNNFTQIVTLGRPGFIHANNDGKKQQA